MPLFYIPVAGYPNRSPECSITDFLFCVKRERGAKPPSFTIRVDGRERETEAHRLSLHRSSLRPDVVLLCVQIPEPLHCLQMRWMPSPSPSPSLREAGKSTGSRREVASRSSMRCSPRSRPRRRLRARRPGPGRRGPDVLAELPQQRKGPEEQAAAQDCRGAEDPPVASPSRDRRAAPAPAAAQRAFDLWGEEEEDPALEKVVTAGAGVCPVNPTASNGWPTVYKNNPHVLANAVDTFPARTRHRMPAPALFLKPVISVGSGPRSLAPDHQRQWASVSRSRPSTRMANDGGRMLRSMAGTTAVQNRQAVSP